MSGTGGDLVRVIATLLHDMQSRLSAIRIALTAVGDVDGPFAGIVAAGDGEALRLSTDIATVRALVGCMQTDEEPALVNLTDLVRRAADTALLAGSDVRVQPGSAEALVPAVRTALALPMVLRLVAGVRGHAAVDGTGDLAVVRVRAEGGDEPRSPAVEALVTGMGAVRIPAETGVAFGFPRRAK